MKITPTEEVRLFREVTGAEQTLVLQLVATVEEAYLKDILNNTKHFTNYNVADFITHLQENYG